MAERVAGEPDERPGLRRAVRHELRRLDPALRVVAEGFQAEASAMDLLAIGPEGELVSVRIGLGEDDDARLLTAVLADLAWLRPRGGDFLKLAPGLGLEPSAEPRALLVCPGFGRETRAAVESFPTGWIGLVGYQPVRRRGRLEVVLRVERTGELDATRAHATGGRTRVVEPTGPGPAPPSGRSSFRTGLRDEDLASPPSVEPDDAKPLDPSGLPIS